MNAPNRVAIAIAAIIALSACSEAEMPLPAAEPPTPEVSVPPVAETVIDSPTLDQVAAPDPDSPPPAKISVEVAGICNIESIGGVGGPALDSPVQVQSDTTVSGWRAYKAADGTEAPAWLRVLGQDGGVMFQTPLPATVDRPDVADAVNRESALQSGFSQVNVAGLTQGSYTLEVVLNAGTEWVRCQHTRTLQVM
jgi:hypothetical protein